MKIYQKSELCSFQNILAFKDKSLIINCEEIIESYYNRKKLRQEMQGGPAWNIFSKNGDSIIIESQGDK